MKTNALREMSVPQLKTELLKLWQESFNLRLLKGSKQEVKPHLFKQVRQKVARVNTIITEKDEKGR